MKKKKRAGAVQADSPSFTGVRLYTDGSHIKLSMLCEYAAVCCFVFGVLLLLRSMTPLLPYTLESRHPFLCCPHFRLQQFLEAFCSLPLLFCCFI